MLFSVNPGVKQDTKQAVAKFYMHISLGILHIHMHGQAQFIGIGAPFRLIKNRNLRIHAS